MPRWSQLFFAAKTDSDPCYLGFVARRRRRGKMTNERICLAAACLVGQCKASSQERGRSRGRSKERRKERSAERKPLPKRGRALDSNSGLSCSAASAAAASETCNQALSRKIQSQSRRMTRRRGTREVWRLQCSDGLRLSRGVRTSSHQEMKEFLLSTDMPEEAASSECLHPSRVLRPLQL